MTYKSLILGSVAAAGLTTAGYAADLGVLTSLDVCDALGISGLTLSSDSNCLTISGSVSYFLAWGDYKADRWLAVDRASSSETPNPGTMFDDGVVVSGAGGEDGEELDWRTKSETLLKLTAASASDVGPVRAVIELKSVTDWQVRDEGAATRGPDATGSSDENGTVILNQAYISVGDATVLMAGKKSTIGPRGDDEPFNFLGMMNANAPLPTMQGFGVNFSSYTGQTIPVDGASVQIVSNLGNGWSVGAALENLDAQTSYAGATAGIAEAGTAIGFVSYGDETVSGHATVLAGGVLDGIIENWGLHAGITGNFGPVRLRTALAADDTGYWNGLVSAEGRYDMFTLAASAEATSGSPTVSGDEEYGFGASASAKLGDVLLNAGFKWFDTDVSLSDNEIYQIALQALAPLTESIQLTGEVGYYGGAAALTDGTPFVFGSGIDDYYVGLGLTWSPAGPPSASGAPPAPGVSAPPPPGSPPSGNGFFISARGELFTSGAFRTTFLGLKTF